MSPIIQQMEGLSLLIAGALILFVWRRKEKNRLFQALGWFFIGGAIFRLGAFFSGAALSLSHGALLGMLASVLSSACLHYGIAVYVSVQMGFLGGQKWFHRSLGIGLVFSTLLTIFHLAALGLLGRLGATLEPFLFPVTITVHSLAGALLFALVVWFAAAFRGEKKSIPASAAMHSGLGFLLFSWILQKLVQTEFGSAASIFFSALPFVAIVIVIVSIFLQTSSATAPGVVVHAMTKAPIGLALVRIFRTEDKKLLESRVTSADGRYGILIEPGSYTLDVTAKGFQFPTKQALGYRGEILTFSRPTLVGVDIFLDPAATP